jgi:hypothetical protein
VDFTGTVTKDGVGQPNVFVLIVVTNPLGSTTGPGSYQNAVTTDATGRYSDFYRLPTDAPLGTYTVTVSATSGGVTVASTATTFTVSPLATLSLTPEWATPGSTVGFSGTGYTAGASFKVTLAWGGITVDLATFDYVVTVKDPDGRVLYPISAATGISVDTTGTTITVTYAVPTGAKAGTWTVSIVILQAGAVVDVAVITFTVT